MVQEIVTKLYQQYEKRGILFNIIFFSLLSLYVFAGIFLAPFHGDESAFIQLSEDYDLIFKNHDIESVLFSPEDKPRQNLRLTTGSIFPYFIGFTRDVINLNHPLPKNWRWEIPIEENIEKKNMPSKSLLLIGRFCSVLMGIVGIIIFYLVSFNLSSSRLVAGVSTFMLATHGDVLVNIRRAMQEGPKFLFLILVVYIASLLIKNFQDIKRNKVFYLWLGVASGILLATKQDTAIMLVAVYLALIFSPILVNFEKNNTELTLKKITNREFYINFFYLVLSTFLTFSIFLLLMPVFWSWWVNSLILLTFVVIVFQLPTLKVSNRIHLGIVIACIFLLGVSSFFVKQWSTLLKPITKMIDVRNELLNNQLSYYAGNEYFELDSPKNKAIFLLQTTLTSRAMYMENNSFDVPYIRKQIDRYEATRLSGRNGLFIFDILGFIIAVFGIWYLLKKINIQSFFILSLLIVTGILLFATIPLPWQRYYLIIQIPYSLIIGVGAKQVFNVIKNKSN